MKRRLKVNGVIIFFAFMLMVIFPDTFLRRHRPYSLNMLTEVLGIALIILGQILRVSSRGFKSEHSANGSLLIQGGPYRAVRNPMYLGILLIGLGIVLMLFKWWAVGIFLLAFILRYLRLIFEEEKKMRALFSADYQDYCRRVPRILPSITTIINTDIVEYLPLKSAWLKKEISSIVPVLLVVFFLVSWRDIKNEGPSAYVKEAVMIIATVILFMGLVIYLNRRTGILGKDVPDKSQVSL